MIRRRVAGTLGAGLAIYGATVGLPAHATGAGVATANLTTVAPCQNVMFIGVRGSGETPSDGTDGMGEESSLAWDTYRTQVTGRAISAMSIDYPSAPVTALASPYTNAAFFRSIDTGVTKLEGVLADRSKVCPNERYVLSGKSQGAIVVHRAMVDMSAHPEEYGPRLMARIDGVIAIADPDRVADDSGSSYGTSSKGSDHYGLSIAAPWIAGNRFRPSTATVDTYWTYPRRWHSVCNAGDAVCDFAVASSSPAAMLHGFDVHSYSYVTDPTPIRRAATAVAKQTLSNAGPTDLTVSDSPA